MNCDGFASKLNPRAGGQGQRRGRNLLYPGFMTQFEGWNQSPNQTNQPTRAHITAKEKKLIKSILEQLLPDVTRRAEDSRHTWQAYSECLSR